MKFKVGYTYVDSAGTEFLDPFQDYQTGFVVFIFSSDLQNLPEDPAATYDRSTMEVTGAFSMHGGYYQILNPTKLVSSK